MDEYLTKELLLPRGGDLITARDLKRTRDGDGIPTGCQNSNSILDNRQYKVELPDGSVDTYTANAIAENLTAIFYPERQQYALFRDDIDHRFIGHKEDMTYLDKHGNEQPKMP
jgi:hypothetical protein